MMAVVVIEIALAAIMVRDFSVGEHTMQILYQQSAMRGIHSFFTTTTLNVMLRI